MSQGGLTAEVAELELPMPSDSSDFDVGLIIPLSEEFGYVRELLPPQRTIQRGGGVFFALETPPDVPRMLAVRELLLRLLGMTLGLSCARASWKLTPCWS